MIDINRKLELVCQYGFVNPMELTLDEKHSCIRWVQEQKKTIDEEMALIDMWICEKKNIPYRGTY